MSAKQPDSTDLPDEEQSPKTWRDALPFIIAFAVVALVLGGIGMSHLIRPAEERVSDSAKIQYVVNDYFTAHNSLKYETFRDTQCDAAVGAKDFPTAAEFVDTNRTAFDSEGKLVVPEMKVEVTGDRAAVVATVKREGSGKETKTDLTVIKQGEDWKVCNA